MKYTINFDEKLLVERWVDQWVLCWCKKYHPEAFKEAREFISGALNQTEESIEKNKTN